MKCLKSLAFCLLLAMPGISEPVRVRRVHGYLHGFVVVRNTDDQILASGDAVQTVAGAHINSTLTLHFRDGSLYEERAVFSQHEIYRLVSYKQVQKGPSFK